MRGIVYCCPGRSPGRSIFRIASGGHSVEGKGPLRFLPRKKRRGPFQPRSQKRILLRAVRRTPGLSCRQGRLEQPYRPHQACAKGLIGRSVWKPPMAMGGRLFRAGWCQVVLLAPLEQVRSYPSLRGAEAAKQSPCPTAGGDSWRLLRFARNDGCSGGVVSGLCPRHHDNSPLTLTLSPQGERGYWVWCPGHALGSAQVNSRWCRGHTPDTSSILSLSFQQDLSFLLPP